MFGTIFLFLWLWGITGGFAGIGIGQPVAMALEVVTFAGVILCFFLGLFDRSDEEVMKEVEDSEEEQYKRLLRESRSYYDKNERDALEHERWMKSQERRNRG